MIFNDLYSKEFFVCYQYKQAEIGVFNRARNEKKRSVPQQAL
jgi:hypothetical protein